MGNSSNKKVLDIPTHLHFELIVNDVNIDPLPYLQNIKGVEDLTKEETLQLINEVLNGVNSTTSTYAKDSWNKATKEGIVDGTNPKGYCTREMLIKVLSNKGVI